MSEADDMVARAVSRLNKAQRPKRARGRPVDPAVEARRGEAALLGVHERTLRRAAAAEKEPANYGLDDLGLGLPVGALEVAAAMSVACRHMRAARAALEKAAAAPCGQRVGGAATLALAACEAVCAARPASVCAYCKRVPGLCQECPGCHGTGLLTAAEMLAVPGELLKTGGDAGIYVDGEWRLLSTLR